MFQDVFGEYSEDRVIVPDEFDISGEAYGSLYHQQTEKAESATFHGSDDADFGYVGEHHVERFAGNHYTRNKRGNVDVTGLDKTDEIDRADDRSFYQKSASGSINHFDDNTMSPSYVDDTQSQFLGLEWNDGDIDGMWIGSLDRNDEGLLDEPPDEFDNVLREMAIIQYVVNILTANTDISRMSLCSMDIAENTRMS